MAEKLLKRCEVPVEKTWRLEDIYETNEAWDADYAKLSEQVDALKTYEGKLTDRAKLLEYCNLSTDAEQRLGSLYGYARMRRDEDNANPVYQALVARIQALATRLSTAVSFVGPELLAAPEGYLESVRANPDFSDYDMYLDDLIRHRPHTLSAAEEKLVAMAGDVASAPSTIYDMLTDADMRFPEITDEDGDKLRVTHANYIPLVMSRDARVRKDAFDALYTTYRSFSSTIPAVYAASVQADLFRARAGKHASALAASLFPDNIPESVYNNLILAVNEHLPSLQKFVQTNAKLNGIDEMHFYDLYLAPELGFDVKLPFNEAYDLVIDCLKVLGEDYCDVLRRARDERWIDPFENEGKSSGAYSWGTYATHPYVLWKLQARPRPSADHRPRNGSFAAHVVLQHAALPEERLFAVRRRGRLDRERGAGADGADGSSPGGQCAGLPALQPAGFLPRHRVPPDDVRRVREEQPRDGRARRSAHRRKPERRVRRPEQKVLRQSGLR